MVSKNSIVIEPKDIPLNTLVMLICVFVISFVDVQFAKFLFAGCLQTAVYLAVRYAANVIEF